ncbi:hypothetical protein LCGC14_1200400 [marine sediment metagenome]|uniref:Uncharacterized protein n=1 Tax=marine sediment metagenome TaxID=412755 RepID=A0A0F9M4D5_9ZZZZ
MTEHDDEYEVKGMVPAGPEWRAVFARPKAPYYEALPVRAFALVASPNRRNDIPHTDLLGYTGGHVMGDAMGAAENNELLLGYWTLEELSQPDTVKAMVKNGKEALACQARGEAARLEGIKAQRKPKAKA